MGPHAHARTALIHRADCDLRVLAWRPGRVQQEPFSRASFWQGLYFPVQIRVCTVLCTQSRHVMLPGVSCGYQVYDMSRGRLLC